MAACAPQTLPRPGRTAVGALALRWRMAALWVLTVIAAPALHAVQQLNGELHIVGIVVNERETGATAAYRYRDQFWLPLNEILRTLGFELVADSSSVAVQTAIGSAEVTSSYLAVKEGQTYISQAAFPALLATGVQFDAGDYALLFEPPMPSISANSKEAVVPDVLAPSWSLSRLDTEASYLYREDEDVNYFSAELGGALGGGQWQGRVLRDSLGDAGLEDYVWLRRSQDRVWAVGSRQVALHPLLPAFEFTGAAVSQSPRIATLFDTVSTGRQLSRSDQSAVRDFDGLGPAGGVAELRIDQVVLERVRIGLDGRYEFRNIALPARGYQQIEVHLYERSSRVAVRIDDYSQTVSQVVLPAGTYFASAGAGVSGNPLSQARSLQDEEFSFLAQARYGFTDSLTGELMVQRDGTQVQFLAGSAVQIGERWNAAAAVAGSEDGQGYHVETNGLGQHWRVRAYALERDAGLGRDAGRVVRQQMDFQWFARPGLSFGLLGRSEEIDRIDRSFLKPTLAWFAGRSFSLRSYPDAEGDYRHDVQYRPSVDWRLAWSGTENGDLFDVSHRLDRRWRARITHQGGGSLDDRQVLSVTRFAATPWGATIETGLSRTNGQAGYFVDALFSVISGLRARLELRNEPIYTGLDSVPREFTAQLTLFGDFTLAGRRLVPARSTPIATGRGGIAGRLLVDDAQAARWDLEHAAVLVDGSPRGKVGPGGTFFIDQLAEGVHKIRINEATLPIELRDAQGALNVEVRGGAITPVDLRLAPYYGFAGQVTDSQGTPVPAATLVILDQNGDVAARSISDQYGLYRVDGLPGGDYLVGVERSGSDELSNQLAINDLSDFLFGQDIVVSSVPDAADL